MSTHLCRSRAPAAPVVLDTNVFVAAGFNSQSASARLLSEVQSGRLQMIWNEQTRRETRHILEKIPPLSWTSVAPLFREENRYDGPTDPGRFSHIPDPDDWKFAALAEGAGAVLVTNDAHLLSGRNQTGLRILTPEEICKRDGK